MRRPSARRDRVSRLLGRAVTPLTSIQFATWSKSVNPRSWSVALGRRVASAPALRRLIIAAARIMAGMMRVVRRANSSWSFLPSSEFRA